MRRKKYTQFFAMMKQRFAIVTGIIPPRRVVKRRNKMTLGARFYGKFYSYLTKKHRHAYKVVKLQSHGLSGNAKSLYNATNDFWWYDIRLIAQRKSWQDGIHQRFSSLFNTN